jgi:Tol biopolymer transport system component
MKVSGRGKRVNTLHGAGISFYAPRMFIRATLSGLALTATCFAAESSGETNFLANARQLTIEGKRSGEGYFSPDGKMLVFQSEREADNPFYQIYTLDLESGDTRRISPGQGKTTCAFFRPGSDEVMFASTHHDPLAREKQKAEFEFRASGKQKRYSWDYDDAMDLFVAKRDGSNVRQLTTSPGYDAEGAFSPDGKLIVFSSLRSAYPTNQLSPTELKLLENDPAYFGEIYLMNADGSDVRRLTRTPGYDGGPFFSADGQRIVWRRFETNGVVADVWTMKLDGSDARRVTDFGCMSWAPYFHPSGDYLVFTANKLGFANFELFIADARGGREPVRVTFTDGFDGLPVFSPDGKKLAWTSNRGADGKSQIYLADWNDAAARRALAATTTATTSAELKPAASLPLLAQLSNDVTHLASPKFDGRMTGTEGARLAAEFLAEQLRAAGLRPFGVSNTFFQPFEFNAGVRVRTNENKLLLATNAVGRGVLTAPRLNRSDAVELANASPRRAEDSTPYQPQTFLAERDFRPLAFTSNGTVRGDVVFAGYGLAVPGKLGEGYDSYAGLDVSNKIVLVLRYVPEEVDAKRRQELNRYAGLRYKAMLARERGAKAILFVTGPNSPNAGELAALSSDSAGGGSGIIAASVTTNVAMKMFATAGKDLRAVQSALDKEDPHAIGSFALSNVTVSLTTAVEHLKKTDRNVLAVWNPPGGARGYVVVGAHYDHLGHGESGAMRRAGEEDSIHFGADDNASGTAAVLALARVGEGNSPRPYGGSAAYNHPGLIFAFWSGEEMGLIGSSHFVEHPPVALTNIVACFNFDMVGRLRDNKLMLQGLGSSTAWRRLIEKRNVAAGFNLTLQDDPYLPTDVTAFYPRGVPVLNFFTGSHDDYHRPTDTAEKINYEGLERIVKLARGLLTDTLAATQRLDYVKVASSNQGGGSRDNLRAYLGTIPDYATEVAGVKISGTRGGSPAEKAGLLGGDVIVEFAGQKIANIYDYTYALDAVKIGVPITIVVQRGGERVTIQATPEARK